MIHVLHGRPHFRPCAHIPPEGHEGAGWGATPIAEMYERLTAMPPLAPEAEAALRNLFRRTRLVPRVARALEAAIAAGVRHAPRTIN